MSSKKDSFESVSSESRVIASILWYNKSIKPMILRNKTSSRVEFICPFCGRGIKFSSKTEIYYRTTWVDGCSSCFALSIDKNTAASFQQKDY